ncbi:unnamed protein product [Ectocarpus sp. 12 AP-2014]
MEEPLTSSDHLRSSEGGAEGVAWRPAEESRGWRLFPFCRGGRTTVSPEQDSLASRYGLLDVAEIRSKDLMTVVVNGIVMTLLYLLLGGLWLMISDAWSFTDTVYFMSTSMLTIGYGDVVVNGRGADRLLDSVLIVLGLFSITIWAACASQWLSSVRSRRVEGHGPVADFDAELSIRLYSWKLFHRLVILFVVVVVGVVAFMLGEGTPFTTSLYWVIVTSSTIGYGDVVPTSPAMKWFTSFYSIAATGAMLETLRCAGTFPFTVWTLRAEAKVFGQFSRSDNAAGRAAAASLADCAITELLGIPPEERPGGVAGRSDVALSMLLLLNRVSYDDVQQVSRIYDNLKADRGDAALARPPLQVQAGVGSQRS